MNENGIDESIAGVSYYDPATQTSSVNWLLTGSKWGGAIGQGAALTYSYTTAASSFSDTYQADDAEHIGPDLTQGQKQAIEIAFGLCSAYANITFNLVADTASGTGDIRWGNSLSASNPTAFAYFPSQAPEAGDIWFGPDYAAAYQDPLNDAYGMMTHMHELGHALGLKHTFGGDLEADPLHDQGKYSIMSYTFPGGYPETYMLDDIAALQYLYGANRTWHTGNDVYSWDSDALVFETIWDADGIDTIDASNQAEGVDIRLQAGTFSEIGQTIWNGQSYTNDHLAIAYDCIIENATGSAFDDELHGNAVANLLIGGGGNDLLEGLAGADKLDGGNGADTLDGGSGADTLTGGSGNDRYLVDNAGDVVIESSASAAEIDLVQSSVNFTLGANLEQLQLLGGAGLNGFGNGLDNLLTGNAGNNLLSGGAGKDTLAGGLGNDTYVVDSTGDVVVETSAQATEIDTVRASVNYTLGANVENLQLEGSAGLNGFGNALANVLTGNAGNNVLGGGAGKDTMIGGLGDDSYQVDDAGDLVVETSTLASEIDTVQSSVNYTLVANVEKLVLLGSSGLNGFGNGLNNTLTGNAGNNLLSGGAGSDTLIGGAGSDIYLVDDATDQVIETVTAAQDVDTVRASVDYILGDNLEQLQLQGDANLAGQGNGLANALTGNAGRNQLSGWAGNDTLDGGLGADTLVGGTGNDLYLVDNAGDLVVETSSLTSEIDAVQSSVNFALGANVESLRLTGAAGLNGIGNALDNLLVGNAGKNQLSGAAGADTLDGGLGTDVMTGGLGNDSYWVDDSGDVVVETSALATEIDTVNATVNFTLGANLEKLQLQGTSGLNGFGNALDNDLRGNAGNNRLGGGAGADTLAGGAGTDVLTGGAGNDTYLFGRGDGLDTVVENDDAAANQDTVLLQAGIALNQLRFSRNGNDLEVGIADTTDRLRVQDWYLGTARHVERFQAADGSVLLDSQIDALVQSMAGFVAKPASHSLQPARIDDGAAFQLAPHRYFENRPMFGQLER